MLHTHQVTCTTDSPDIAVVKGRKVYVKDCVVLEVRSLRIFLSQWLYLLLNIYTDKRSTLKTNVTALSRLIVLFHKFFTFM